MQIAEQEIINKRLIEYYGLFTNGQANWRVVFSDDEVEYRANPLGVLILCKKYSDDVENKIKGWLHNQWVLEKLIPIPELNNKELVGNLSYEPAFALPPGLPLKWEAIDFVVKQVMENLERGPQYFPKYTEDESEKNTPEGKKLRTDQLMKDLFGNETAAGDALAAKEGISVPHTYQKRELN